jgi:hypothetical protein
MTLGRWPSGKNLTIRAIPSMSDQFYRLAQNLATKAQQHPEDISIPAGTTVVAAAALEAYVNEFAEIVFTHRAQAKTDFDKLKDNLIGKLEWLHAQAQNPAEAFADMLDDVRSLYGLRGLLMHYRPSPEHPAEKRTTFQRMAERFPDAVTRETELSTASLLTPDLARWAVEVFERTISSLYEEGWDPPRPQWLQMLDPEGWSTGRPRSSS